MKLSHFILALLVNAAWGFNVVAVKIGLQHFTPVFFTFIRFSVLALLMLPWLRISHGQMGRILAIAMTAGVLHFSTFFTAVYYAENVASVAILLQLSAPFASILAVIFLHEKMDIRKILGIATAFCGAMLIGFEPVVFNTMNAVWLTVFAALAYASSAVIVRTLNVVNVLQIQAWLALLSIPCLGTLSLLFETGQWNQLLTLTPTAGATLAYTVLGASLLGHGGMYYLLKRYPVTLISPFMLLTPVIGVLAAVLMLDNAFTLRMLAGGIVTLIGIAIITVQLRQLSKTQNNVEN